MANLVTNKKVSKDYKILEEFSAGISLLGTEVKSLKNKNASLDGSYIKITDKGAIISSMYIPPYQKKNTKVDYDEYRDRQLLLSKKEIKELYEASKAKGLTVVPLSLYNKGKIVKVNVAIVKGLKKQDKREKIKARDTKRDVERETKMNF